MSGWIRLALPVVFVLYVWGYLGFRARIKLRHPLMLCVGALLDWVVSLRMSQLAGDSLTVHGVAGFIGLAGMSLFAFLSLVEYRLWKFNPRYTAARLARINVPLGGIALAVWILSFITGFLTGFGVIPRI